MNLGFVGVGPWAQKLATAFRECGAEVACHDRKLWRDTRPDIAFLDTFGGYKPWEEQAADANIDALIICAPPDVTTEVALACAKAGKRCVATKPLMLTERIPTRYERMDPKYPGGYMGAVTYDPDRRFYVDLWRLYSPAWLAMKEELRGKKIERIDVAFCGNGPFRSFNGALDYGPHALAFLFDLTGEAYAYDHLRWLKLPAERGELWEGGFELNCTEITVRIGNGAEKPERKLLVTTDSELHWFLESQATRVQRHRYAFDEREGFYLDEPMDRDWCLDEYGRVDCESPIALRRFCRAFMAGEASRTLEYSIAAQRVLEGIVGA